MVTDPHDITRSAANVDLQLFRLTQQTQRIAHAPSITVGDKQ